MKNAIVTGGSRGLGLAIARRLVAAGYRVIAIARKSSEPLAALIAESEAVRPGSLHFASGDLAALETIPGLVRDLRSRFGPFHGLVNNAGSSLDGALALMPDSDIERLVRLNTVSPMILTKYVVRSMMAHGGGRVINIASIVGFTGYSGLAVYAATKASLLGFTRSLAREVGRGGINVNAIAPGFVETELTSGLTEKQREQIARRSALKRLTDPTDVAAAVEYLLGDAGKSVTGTVLTVDAGSTA
jgi:3-oxoacyl-[acyl-carrier protein] reductase